MPNHASLSTRTRHVGTLYFVALLREELGRRIQTARKEAGLTQQELAAAIGLKHAHDISRYERGKTEVPSFRIDRIAEATSRPRSYFTRDPTEVDAADGQRSLEEVRQGLAQIRDLAKTADRIEAMLRELLGGVQAPPGKVSARRPS